MHAGRFACGLILLIASGTTLRGGALSAQTPAPAPAALVARVLAADTDDARRALAREHPELGTDPTFSAVRQAVAAEGAAPDPTRAYNGYRVLIEAAALARDDRRRVLALAALGTLGARKANFALAEAALSEAAAYGEATRDPDIIIPAANNLGIAFVSQGRFDEALASYRRSLRAAETAGRRESVARSLNNIGDVASAQGDFRTALEYLTRSVVIKETLGDQVAIARTSSNIGSIHLRQGSFDQALERFERAREVGRRAGNVQLQVGGAIDVALVHIAQGRGAEALSVLQDALPLAETLADPVLLGDLWQSRGRASLGARNWSEARAALSTALGIQETSGNRAGQADTLLELARLELRSRQPAAALPYATRATDIARRIGLAPALWASLSLLGSAYTSLGRQDEAIAAFTASIAEVERARQQVAGGAEDVRRFFEEKTTPYYELAALHASAGRAGEAFSLMERARARVLLDLIAGGKPILGPLTAPQRAREAALNAEIAVLYDRLDSVAAGAGNAAAQAAEVARIEAALSQARRAREEWQFETFGAHPDLAFSRGEAPVVPLEDAVRSLPSATAALVFLSEPDRTRALLVSRDAKGAPRVQLLEIPITRRALDARAEAFRRQIARRDLGFSSEARALYTLLVAEAERAIGTSHIVIVPDGPLWNLPFQALMSPRGRFLIEERAVSYAPSLSAMYRLRERREQRGTRPDRLVALGDPAGPSGNGRLPHAAREVRGLATLYGRDSRVFTGPAATEGALRTAAREASVVHIATHGELGPSSPMYSFLTLGGTAGAVDPAEDGRLEAWEVANLALPVEVAVLSACESARGATGGGEGVMGLSWSLFAAGASTAVVSLWKVDSSSTTDLMLAFHRARVTARAMPGAAGSGRTSPGRTAAAMRTASRALLATREYRHPFYWAGFIVAGAP